jgi:hypothetical protein
MISPPVVGVPTKGPHLVIVGVAVPGTSEESRKQQQQPTAPLPGWTPMPIHLRSGVSNDEQPRKIDTCPCWLVAMVWVLLFVFWSGDPAPSLWAGCCADVSGMQRFLLLAASGFFWVACFGVALCVRPKLRPHHSLHPQSPRLFCSNTPAFYIVEPRLEPIESRSLADTGYGCAASGREVAAPSPSWAPSCPRRS